MMNYRRKVSRPIIGEKNAELSELRCERRARLRLCRQAFLNAARLGDQRTSAMAADIVEGAYPSVSAPHDQPMPCRGPEPDPRCSVSATPRRYRVQPKCTSVCG